MRFGTDRRGMMMGVGAAAFATAAGSVGRAAARRSPRLVDVHHHFVSPAFADFNRRFAPNAPPNNWNLPAHLADMEQAGVAVSVLSGFTPSEGGTAADRAALARATNAFGAQLMQDHPGRFALFATLPTPDTDACLKEIAHADTLGALGFTVYTDAGDKWLGDPVFNDLWAELDRRAAVVFVHPHAPPCCTGLVPGLNDAVIEFGTATARTIASLIFGGATQRFPRIRFIFSHGGGVVPFLIQRFLGGTQAEIVPGIITKGGGAVLPQPPGTALGELRKFFYDTAQISNPVSLQALKSVVGTSQILYGTDVWYRTQKDTYEGLATSRVFDAVEMEQVCNGNAVRLMPGLGPFLSA